MEGIIDENCSEQIIFEFYPIKRTRYEEIGYLHYDNSMA